MVSIYKNGKEISEIDFKKIEWNLDKWNGSDWCSGEAWEHKGVMELDGIGYVLFYWNNTEGHHAYGDVISESEAKKNF